MQINCMQLTNTYMQYVMGWNHLNTTNTKNAAVSSQMQFSSYCPILYHATVAIGIKFNLSPEIESISKPSNEEKKRPKKNLISASEALETNFTRLLLEKMVSPPVTSED